MTSAQQSQRTLAHIAEDILADSVGRISMRARAHIQAMGQLPQVNNDEGYQVVAKVRASLTAWRSPVAVSVKRELEVILSHYRAERW